jgi:hypothetical protein
MRRPFPAVLLAVSVVACSGHEDRSADRDATSAAATAAPDTAADTRADETAVPDAAPAPSPAPSGPMPAPDTIGFAGFGPAKFGATPEEVRMAWGKEMRGAADEPGGCYYLQPEPQGGPVSFMIEGDRFVRVDVDAPAIIAPGGGAVGMTIAQVRARYPGMEEMPHKYEENARYLRVTDPAGGTNLLVFETDGSGTVTGWRIGTAPQVEYVEGCS